MKQKQINGKDIFSCVLLNFIFITIILLVLFCTRFLPGSFFTGLIVKAFIFIFFQLFLFACYSFFYKKHDKNKIDKTDKSLIFFNCAKKILPQGLILALVKLAIYSALLYLFRYFFQLQNTIGIIFAIITLWIFFMVYFFLFWFYLEFEENRKQEKSSKENNLQRPYPFFLNLRNSCSRFLKQPLFTFLVFGKILLLLFASFFTLFLFPGFAGMIKELPKAK